MDVASEFRYRDPIVSEKNLTIIISQSGETLDTLMALREAKKKGSKILSIVNVVGSSIARESQNLLYTWAGPEIAVASTKAYNTQLAAFVITSYSIHYTKLYEYYVNDIQHNPEYINVIGEMQVLNKLYTINTNPVDLQGLKDDVKLQSDFQLPENIKLANLQEKETISVDIEPFVTKRFTYSVDKISIYNADQENYTYKIKSTTLSGDATGRLEDVNLFIINPRIKAWINVNNLIEGTHKVDVNTASQNTDIEVVTENSVEVIVEEIRNDDENHSLDNINTNLNTNSYNFV